MKDLGSAGCCGIQPLSRANLNEMLAKKPEAKTKKLAEAEEKLNEAQEEVSLAQWCQAEARRVPRFCKELGH